MSNEDIDTDPSDVAEAALAKPPSIIGHLATLKAGEIALPPYLVKRKDGLYVDTSELDTKETLHAMVSRIFNSNAYFWDLDYDRFIKLLYDYGPEIENPDEPEHQIRFAADIVAFLPERKSLYRTFKYLPGEASYFFEPVFLERPKTGKDFGTQAALIPTKLAFDEFVADAWGKGIRFGILEKTLKAIIKNDRYGLIVIAKKAEEIPGISAGIKELTKKIHRDKTPLELPNGKIDFSQFKNHFPQIDKGCRLLKKIPPIPGTVGFEISGNIIEPPPPRDFDMASLAGPGTVVEEDQDGEYIASAEDGFLFLDPKSNQISISDKIVGNKGVSVRATGDLHLTGHNYEEFGEVQEKRVVEGNSITIHADVFGTIKSRGGTIELKKSLVNGAALNQQGDIIIRGFASGSTVHAKNGDITIGTAERCTIVGTSVTIKYAINCEILADTVNIKKAEGCAVAAKSVEIESAAAYKHNEMQVFILTPDHTEFNKKSKPLEARIEEIKLTLSAKKQEFDNITSQPDVAKYLMLANKIKNNEITLTPDQQVNYKKLAASIAPILQMATKETAESKELQTEKSLLDEQLETLLKQKKDDEDMTYCTINEVAGEVFVSIIKEPLSTTLPPSELRARLRGPAAAGERIFFGEKGAVNWKYHPSSKTK